MYLRKDKFDFSRTQEDIFERREAGAQEIKKEEARQKAISYKNQSNIKPYERKQVYGPKTYNPDEDQVDYLQHLGLEPQELVVLIQREYDEPYITNLLVTGTLSLAVHDKKEIHNDRVRKIQNVNLKSFALAEDTYSESINQSLNYGTQSYLQQSIISSPLKKGKTGSVKSAVSMMRTMNAHE